MYLQDLCHLHSERALIQQKTQAIIQCFVDSPIPPSLQVDITQEMAERIVERRLEASPYLFREAQVGKHYQMEIPECMMKVKSFTHWV